MEGDSMTAISPPSTSSTTPTQARKNPLSNSLSALPKKSPEQHEAPCSSPEEPVPISGELDLDLKNDFLSESGPNWSALIKQIKKSPEERLDRVDGDPQRVALINKKRRASSSDITLHSFISKEDPESPIKQKRHRRTAAEIERGFKCTVSNCHKAYGTEGALKMHLRIKHPSLNTSSSITPPLPSSSSSSSSSRPQVSVNTSAVHQLAAPSKLSFSLNSLENTSKSELGNSTPLNGSPLSPLSVKVESSELSSSSGQSPMLVPSISPNAPVTPHAPTPFLNNTNIANIQNWQSLLGFSDKIKYSNVPLVILRIGTWRKATSFSGDLVAKILYEERKFVWEVYAVTTAVSTLFVRIELKFDDIAGLAFEIHQDIALLTLDFRNPPSFYQAEIVPHQPIAWQPLVVDVSGGDIFTCRRHVLQFSKDAIVQPLQHLLKVEPRLLQLYSANFPGNTFIPFSPFSNSNVPNLHVNIPSTPIYSGMQSNASLLSFSNSNTSHMTQVPSQISPGYPHIVPSQTSLNNTSSFYSSSSGATTPLSSEEEGEEGEEDEEEDEEDMDQEVNTVPQHIPQQIHSSHLQSQLQQLQQQQHQHQHQHQQQQQQQQQQQLHQPQFFHIHPHHQQLQFANAQLSPQPPQLQLPMLQSQQSSSFMNAIPALDLDPKDDKFSMSVPPVSFSGREYHGTQYAGVCACGGSVTQCLCVKGLAACDPLCVCARFAFAQLADGAASVPTATSVLGNFPDISF